MYIYKSTGRSWMSRKYIDRQRTVMPVSMRTLSVTLTQIVAGAFEIAVYPNTVQYTLYRYVIHGRILDIQACIFRTLNLTLRVVVPQCLDRDRETQCNPFIELGPNGCTDFIPHTFDTFFFFFIHFTLQEKMVSNSGTPLLGEDGVESRGEGFKVELPPVIAKPVEGILGTIGAVVQVAISKVQIKTKQVTKGMRPWLEFFDLSAFKLPEVPEDGSEGRLSIYFRRIRINFKWFFLNYAMVAILMTLISEVMKPLALIGVLILMYAYFRLWGHSAEGQENISFLGLYLDDKQRTGFMLVLSVIIFMFASSGHELITRAICGTLFVTAVHGVFRRPHMDALPHDADEEN